MDWHKLTTIRIDKEKIVRLFTEEGLTIQQLKERFSTTSLMIRNIIKQADLAVCSLGKRKK